MSDPVPLDLLPAASPGSAALPTALLKPSADANALVPHSRWGTILAYAYLLRISILIGIILVAFPYVALESPAKPIFQNFFVLDWLPTLLVSFATLIVTWSLVLNVLVVVFNAPDRFQVPRLLTQSGVHMHARLTRWIIALAMMLIAAPMLSGQFLQHDWPHRWLNLWAVIAGAFLAYVLAYLSVFVVMLWVPLAITVATEIFPAPRWLRKTLQNAQLRRSANPSRVWPRVARVFQRLPRDVTAGFIDDRKFTAPGVTNPGYGLPWSGVILAFAFAMATFFVYHIVGLIALTRGDRPSIDIPALGFVLLLLLNISWIFGFGAYFIDRFRIPLLAVLLVAAVIGEAGTDYAEHFYRLTPGRHRAAITPAAVLRPRVRAGKPIIVVATMGGGIQAAAWTVQVLTGLQTQVQQEMTPEQLKGRSFADSIALISSVSGGATGSLFFLNEYRQGDGGLRPAGFAPTDNLCKKVNGVCTDLSPLVDEMVKPRLDGVAWALVYRDLPRILLPYFPGSFGLVVPIAVPDGRYLDRGRMLERSWQRSNISGRLSDWRAGLEEGWRPASIFNATIAETGEPFLFSTTELRQIGSDDEFGRPLSTTRRADPSFRRPQPVTFAGLYEKFDIDLVTAARLASGFPYVLPIPRALPDPADPRDADQRLKYHLIDGGYYDNYGVDTAAQWVDQALRDLGRSGEELPSKVLILQIRAFPDVRLPDLDHPPEGSGGNPDYANALPRNRGWLFELYSPIAGLLHVRSAGQLLHNRDELNLLRAKWAHGQNGGVDIRFATFEFQRRSAPLSFKMNPTQVDDIRKVWSDYLDPHGVSLDLAQVKCMFDDSPQVCAEARRKGPW